MKKVSKTLSNLLLLATIIIGFVMTFISNQAKYQFYFFLISAGLIAVFSLFVFLGSTRNKKTIVEILEKAKDAGLAEVAMKALIKQPVMPQVGIVTSQPTQAAQNNTLRG